MEVTNSRGPWQDVVVTVTRKSETDTDAFRAFLDAAASSFRANLAKLSQGAEAAMPWKQDGERWHTGAKGFPPGKSPKWDPALVKSLITIVREVEPAAEFHFNAQDAVLVKVPGITHSWGRVKTKDPAALEVRLVGKPGQFNLARLRRRGARAEPDARPGRRVGRADAEVPGERADAPGDAEKVAKRTLGGVPRGVRRVKLAQRRAGAVGKLGRVGRA